MSNSFTLSRLRLGVQIVMLFFTVYGGAVVGHYLADKVTGSLPALSCAYDQQNAGYCVLIPMQHQLHHRVGESIVRAQQFSIDYIIPFGFTMLTFLAFFLVLNKAFCGWICPLGTVQELAYKIGRRLKLGIRRFTQDSVGRVRPVKWGVLILMVLVLPLAAGLGYTSYVTGDAYCQVCPSRIVTTLMTANPEQIALNTSDNTSIFFSAARSAIFGFVVILAFGMRQPFCRVCPMLALHAVFRRIAPLRLAKKTSDDKCGKCKACYQACPMDQSDHFHKPDRGHRPRQYPLISDSGYPWSHWTSRYGPCPHFQWHLYMRCSAYDHSQRPDPYHRHHRYHPYLQHKWHIESGRTRRASCQILHCC